MMLNIDLSEDGLFAALKAGVSPAFDMRAGEWVK